MGKESRYVSRPEDENVEIYTGHTYGKIEILGRVPEDMQEIARLSKYQYVLQSQLDEIEKEATHYRNEPEPFSDDVIIAFYKTI